MQERETCTDCKARSPEKTEEQTLTSTMGWRLTRERGPDGVLRAVAAEQPATRLILQGPGRELRTLVLSLALLQPVKGAVVAVQWALRMHGFDEKNPTE